MGRRGATLVLPPAPFAMAIYEPLGTAVGLDNEDHFRAMQAVTGLMGDFYKRQLTAQEWILGHGVGKEQAAAYVGALFSPFAADSSSAGVETFADLVKGQTPGGLNEMVW